MPTANEAPNVAPAWQRAGSARGREGYFRLAQDADGRWWLADPAGAPFFLRGVHGVRDTGIPPDAALPMDAASRLRSWGFNAVGCGRDPSARDDGLPFLASADLARVVPSLSTSGVRLPDVFDPDWPQRAADRAHEICAAQAENPALVGWITDDALDWASPAADRRPSLLQVCLSLEPHYAAYHAAWEFVLASHGGQLGRVARAWNVGLANKEVVRELTRSEAGLATRGFLRDEMRWAREFSRRYFTVATAAIRQADPNHLVFGARYAGRVGAHVLAEGAYPAVDACLLPWPELPAGAAARTQPVLVDQVGWTDPALERIPAGRRAPRLTTFERMLRRGRTAIDRMARHPAVVGYLWRQWQDEAGEQPPFARGLVHANGAEAREHTEVLAAFNARATELHRAAPAGSAGTVPA